MAITKDVAKELTLSPHKVAAVMYTDGSAVQNVSVGSGAHGYIYHDYEDKPNVTKGLKPKQAITTKGYNEHVLKNDTTVEHVTPLAYIDAISSTTHKGTSNTAELTAVIETIEYFINLTEYKIDKLTIKSDSQYTIGVFNALNSKGGYAKWLEKNPANITYGLRMSEVIEKAKENGIVIALVKVLGHSTSFGNHLADRLAHLARMRSVSGKACLDYVLTPAKGYWGKGQPIHTLLRFKNIYILNIDTNRALGRDKYGCEYYVLDYKKDAEPGKKSHEATFGYVELKNSSEPMLEECFRKHLNLLSKHEHVPATVLSMDTTAIYSQFNNLYHKLYGDDIYSFKTTPRFGRCDQTQLQNFNNEVVSRVLQPVGLALQVFNKTIIFNRLIESYRVMDKVKPEQTFVELTDRIYDKSNPKKVVTLLEMGETNLDTEVTIGKKKIYIPIELGSDCIDRNKLKQISNQDTVVYAVIDQEGEKAYRVYVLVHLRKTDDIAMYCNFYNNLILTK